MSQDSLLEFPCSFAIKAMGPAGPDFERTVLDIVRRHAPAIGKGAVRARPSREGRYVSLTVTIDATSREQLDRIYSELNAEPAVLMTL